MDAETRKHLRLAILQVLKSGSRLGVSLDGTVSIKNFLRCQPVYAKVAEADIEGELEYLASGGFAEEVPQDISPELTYWRITKAGRDLLAKVGLD